MINRIKGIGSKTLGDARPKGLIGKKRWQGFQQAYADIGGDNYPLTWEIIQGLATKMQHL